MWLVQCRSLGVRALAQELGVTDRTLYRDLNRIRAAGVPIGYDADAQCLRVWPDRVPVRADRYAVAMPAGDEWVG
jgi:predicted DNA-binding transcriptional regulator YafY